MQYQHLLVQSIAQLAELRHKGDAAVASALLSDEFWLAKFKHDSIPFPIHIRYMYHSDAALKLEAYLYYHNRHKILERKRNKR